MQMKVAERYEITNSLRWKFIDHGAARRADVNAIKMVAFVKTSRRGTCWYELKI